MRWSVPLSAKYRNAANSASTQFSQEFRLASKTKGPIEWQVGGFLYYSKLKDHYVVHQFGADVIPRLSE